MSETPTPFTKEVQPAAPPQPEAARPAAAPVRSEHEPPPITPGAGRSETNPLIKALAPEQTAQKDRFILPSDERELRAMPVIRSQEHWQRMDTFDIGQAIEYGKITDPRALLTLANKEYAAELQKTPPLGEKARAAHEARYRPLIEGDRQALANYAIDKAQPHVEYTQKRAEVDIAFHRAHPDQTMFNVSDSIKAGAEHYGVASQWYELAAQTTAEKEGKLQPQTEAEAKRLLEESRLTNEQHRTLGYLRDHPTQLAALGTLQNLDANSLQTLMDTLEQVKVKEALQAEGEPIPAKTGESSFLIDLLLSLIQGVKEGIVSAARQVPPDGQKETH